jgi:hypothetical protein
LNFSTGNHLKALLAQNFHEFEIPFKHER